jgi:hypothetical protein
MLTHSMSDFTSAERQRYRRHLQLAEIGEAGQPLAWAPSA